MTQIDRETAIVMVYTGWSQETARAAIEQYRDYIENWTAEYMLQYLSARDLEKLERLCGERGE